MLDILLVQMESVLGNNQDSKAKNFAKVRKLLEKHATAADSGNNAANRLFILPEMFATGYIPKDPDTYAEDFNNPSNDTAKFLQALAIENNAIVFGAGIHKAEQERILTNRSVVFVPGEKKVAVAYDKVHPFFPELNRGFAPGESVTLFKIGNWKIASVICYDLRFPELFRDAVKMGANLITVQAAWPKVRKAHWETLLRARAIENQVYIAAVNGVSPSESDSSKQLAGTSMLIDPQGNVIASGSDSAEEIIRGQVHLEPLKKYRQDFPVLQGIAPQIETQAAAPQADS